MVQIFAIVNIGLFGASLPLRVHCATKDEGADPWVCRAFFNADAPKANVSVTGYLVREEGKPDLFVTNPCFEGATERLHAITRDALVERPQPTPC